MRRRSRRSAAVDAARGAAGAPAATGLSEPGSPEPRPPEPGLPEPGLPEPRLPERRASAASLRGRSCLRLSRTTIEAPAFADEADHQADPSRYDDALYGQLDSDAHGDQHDQAYSDDPYAYQDGYADAAEEPIQKRRGGMVTVVVVLALAVLGTGAAFAYRTYVGSPRSGEPPIIKADTGPTKIVPRACRPQRQGAGPPGGGRRHREDRSARRSAGRCQAQSAPRMVFPPLNQNANPPTLASVAPSGPPPANAGNGTMPNNEPRKIKTLSVRGDQPDGAAAPVRQRPPRQSRRRADRAAAASPAPPAAANANASTANAPLSLSPQAGQSAPAAEPRTRVATNTPAQAAPGGARRRRLSGAGLFAAE